MKFTVRVLRAVVWIGVLASPLHVDAQSVRGGPVTFDVPGAGTALEQGTGCFGCTFGLNGAGVVAGTYVDANYVRHGFLRSPDGRFTTLDAPAADVAPFSFHGTTAQSINDGGFVTGYFVDAAGLQHGFVRTPQGRFTSFDVPNAANGTTPIFINAEGAIVGYALDANGLFHAFQRQPDGRIFTFVGPGSCTSGTSANCFGSAASYIDLFGGSAGNFADNSGNFVQHGLLRSPEGKLATFDDPDAGTGFFQGTGCPGCNLGVNIWGWIAGSFTDTNYVLHGFVRSPDGRFITIDAPGAGAGGFQGTGCFSDCPMSINDWGFITGSYEDLNNVQHGFVRRPDGTIVTLDPAGSVGTQPESINDLGLIVGYYIDVNNVAHGFLAWPGKGF